MDRRTFLKNVGIGLGVLAFGKEAYDTYKEHVINESHKQIFGTLKDHVHVAKTTYYFGDKKSKDVDGCGIILNGCYMTMAHITNIKEVPVQTPFGILRREVEWERKEVRLYDNLLEEVLADNEVDVAKYKGKLPPEFPCRPGTVNLGDTVYVIGNPRLSGTNIRRGNVSDLDGVMCDDEYLKHLTSYCFGVGISIHPGDSGCPVVNDKFELVGLAKATLGADLGYICNIKNFVVGGVVREEEE